MNKEQNMKMSTKETTLHKIIGVRTHLQANRFEPLDGDIVFGILELKENSSFVSASLILEHNCRTVVVHGGNNFKIRSHVQILPREFF